MKKLYLLTLLIFVLIKLVAQNHGDIYDISQEEHNTQNTIPNARFPFGEPLQVVRQRDRTPKRVFVLGVYGSAVHAKWYSQNGIVLCEALAVASEPEIFWRGENAAEIIARITIPPEVGYLEPAQAIYNGPSGRALDELYLAPLGLSRADVWLCDLVPHSFMNENQKRAIDVNYIPLYEQYNLPLVTIPEKPFILIDTYRRNEILSELTESQADTIILLGDDPIKWFLSFVSDCKKTGLSDFDKTNYGLPIQVTINGRSYSVIPLAHVRQGGGLGTHNYEWEQLHKKWVEDLNNNSANDMER